MKTHTRSAFACALVLAFAASGASANLLTNGDLDDPGNHESDAATAWTLDEGPGAVNSATFATFADHTGAGGVGLWYRSFVGELEDPTDGDDEVQVSAHLSQTVPGIAGMTYQLSAWAKFEANFSGGVDNLNAEGTDAIDPQDGLASPTDTFLFIEFLDAGDALLPGGLSVELTDDGQTNDNQWLQHFLQAVAPAGTVSVRVGASMIDGVINPGVNPQSAFVDDFVLDKIGGVIPEPTTAAFAMTGALALLFRRPRP